MGKLIIGFFKHWTDNLFRKMQQYPHVYHEANKACEITSKCIVGLLETQCFTS